MKNTRIQRAQKKGLRGRGRRGEWWCVERWNSRFFFFFFFWENVTDFCKERVLKCLLCGGLKFLHLSTKRARRSETIWKGFWKERLSTSWRRLRFLYLGRSVPILREAGGRTSPFPTSLRASLLRAPRHGFKALLAERPGRESGIGHLRAGKPGGRPARSSPPARLCLMWSSC